MKIRDLIGPDDIIIRNKAESKKQILQDMVGLIASRQIALDERHATELLLEREKLGSTGLGDGVAIPHARCDFPANCDRGVAVLLMKLNTPVDFEANDDAPVDIICMLIASQNCGTSHLTTLAAMSRFIRDESSARMIRQASSPTMIWQALNDPRQSSAA
ncbi:MAG: PTS sugar transporter subunit IIA [Proteobacteria bacterium]|jgi:PTS system nitrogen regulatory IIA component|nr:PTS sugar transporter subunit IIA [Alphaproteobacteria bacterium]MDA0307545.1 PTS sugar transporter subunit IIA [Pseudomonadota bacterium]MDA0909740.1 PTS sugar transporter subunit IIA [Pseudomonadota bacterium]MDC1020260.1 PTS sugar transporter subunit IIA [Alphaproteobacteria bacterium]